MARFAPGAPTRLLLGGLLLITLSSPPARMVAAPQERVVFPPERFERTGGPPEVFTRQFTVPSSVTGPFVLRVINGQPNGNGRVAIEDAVAAGRITLNGVEIAGPSDFSVRVGYLEKTVTPAVSNVLEITLASGPGSFITVSIAGVLTLEDMTRARAGHTASVLGDGTVLIAGGNGTAGIEATAERFDPATRTFTGESASLGTGRAHHTVSVLPDARHLLAAGANGGGVLPASELFDGHNGTFTNLSAGLLASRTGHTATVLQDGRVLVAGGRQMTELGSSEIFDGQPAALFKPPYVSSTGQFLSSPHQLAESRFDHTATLLPDGRVLITGGENASGVLASAEVFDPAADAFVQLPASLPAPRTGHSATLLPDGRVLLLGGRNGGGTLGSGVMFDPVTNSFSAAAERLARPRAHHTATLLHYGEILIAGGDVGTGPIAHTELLRPAGMDALAPRVVSFNPAPVSTGVDLTQVISLRFSEPLDVTTLHPGTVNLAGSAAVPTTLAISEDGLLLFVLPAAPLETGTPYLLTISGVITDTSGNPLEPASLAFTTVAAPIIAAVEPATGPEGSELSILGAHFDPVAPRNVVAIGALPSGVTAATDARVDTTVPAGAPAGGTTVTVTTRGGTASATFTVTNVVPSIASLTPDTVNAGSGEQLLSITGAGFAPGAHINFGSTPLLPNLRTATQLQVIVPPSLLNTIGTAEVTVTNPAPGGGASNALTFTIRGVRVTSIAPASAAPGTTVTITGEGFDPVIGNNQVSFNGTPASVTGATEGAIEVTVPAGASSGPITVVTPIGQAQSEPFTVTTAATLLLSKVPDQPVYAPGAPVTISSLVVDSSGAPVPNATVELTSSPAEGERTGDTFRYFSDGVYTITARAFVEGSPEPITASTQVRVETQTASIACNAPVDGGMVTGTPGSILILRGTATAAAGLTALTVNGNPAVVDSTGAFTAAITTAWGINLVSITATTTSGQQTQRTCTFLLSDGWASDTQTLTDVVSLRQTQAVVDDGSRSGSINSFADILHAVVNSEALRNTVHSGLAASNPLKPSSCDSQTCTFVGCICWYRTGVDYVDSRSLLGGPKTVSLTLLAGGLRSVTRLEDMGIRLRLHGDIGPIPYDTTGVVRFQSVEVTAIHDLGLVNGRPRTQIRSGSVTVSTGTITTEFSGIDGFILNNIVVPLAQGTLRGILTNTLRDFVTNRFDATLDSVMEGLAAQIPTTFNVPRLDDSGSMPATLATAFSTLHVTNSRMLSGLGTRLTTVPAHARPSLGVAVRPGIRILDAGGAPVVNAMHLALLNQGLHALWRGGYFDVTLRPGMLDGLIPSGVTLTTTAALPPVVSLLAPDRQQISAGGLRVQIVHPSLAQPVTASLGGRVSCASRLESDQVRLEACTVDHLDVVADAVLTAAEQEELRQLLGDTLRATLVRAAHASVPAFPILSFEIPSSLGIYGLPVGARLGVINPALRQTPGHLVVEGAFGIR